MPVAYHSLGGWRPFAKLPKELYHLGRIVANRLWILPGPAFWGSGLSAHEA